MQVVFDEHISARIVKALTDNARLPGGMELVSIYDLNLTSTEDETWLERYAASGGTFFVSGDRKMLQRPTLLNIILRESLVGFYFRKNYAEQTRIMQLSYAAYWWEAIQHKIVENRRGVAWIVPNELSGRSLKQVNIPSAIAGLSAKPRA